MTELLENENNFEALDQLIEDFTTETTFPGWRFRPLSQLSAFVRY